MCRALEELEKEGIKKGIVNGKILARYIGNGTTLRKLYEGRHSCPIAILYLGEEGRNDKMMQVDLLPVICEG